MQNDSFPFSFSKASDSLSEQSLYSTEDNLFVFSNSESRSCISPTSLWGYTFVRCGIEEIVLPDQLRIIPPFAFKDCRNLRKVVCGAGLEKIYAWAFGGCDLLTEDGLIHGPKVEISPQAFERH